MGLQVNVGVYATVTHSQAMHRWVQAKPLNAADAIALLAASENSGQYTNGGPAVSAVAASVHQLLNLPKESTVTMAASGTAALHALVAAVHMRAGSPLRWVTQAGTFPCAVQGPLRDRVTVVDMHADLDGPDLAGVPADTQGLVVTNVFGHPCRGLDVYLSWAAAAPGRVLVFDNAAAPATTVDSHHHSGGGAVNLCSVPGVTASIVSFHETKPLGRGEGGAIVCNDATLQPYITQALNFGFNDARTVWHAEASNWRMSDIAAAFLHARLLHAVRTKYVEANKAAVAVVHKFLATDEGVRSVGVQWMLPPTSGTVLSCLMLRTRKPLDLPHFKMCTGVDARRYYHPLIGRDCAPVSWDRYEHCVCLPLVLDEPIAPVKALIQFLTADPAM